MFNGLSFGKNSGPVKPNVQLVTAMDPIIAKAEASIAFHLSLTLTANEDKFDVTAHVHGGGFTGQAGAIRLGLARALLEAGVERTTLKVK